MAQDDIVGDIEAMLGGSPTNQPFNTGQTQWPIRYIIPEPQIPYRRQIVAYQGPGLVGRSNNIEQDFQYDLSEGAVRNLYAEWSANPAAKQLYLDILKRKGYYGRGQVGVPQDDIQAIKSLLNDANIEGLTYDRYLDELLKGRPDQGAGGGGGAPRRYRLSNPEDLRAVFKRAAQDIIGRGFTDEEAERAVQAYQQREIEAQQAYYSGAAQVTEAPSAQAFAQRFAQQIAPTEANAYKFLGIVNSIANATQGVQ